MFRERLVERGVVESSFSWLDCNALISSVRLESIGDWVVGVR
jgi:hypothetical protein